MLSVLSTIKKKSSHGTQKAKLSLKSQASMWLGKLNNQENSLGLSTLQTQA